MPHLLLTAAEIDDVACEHARQCDHRPAEGQQFIDSPDHIGTVAEVIAEINDAVANLEGIDFVYFSEKDVVRHKLVQMIIRAYEEQTKRSQM